MKNIVNLQNYDLAGNPDTEIASFVGYYNLRRHHESLRNPTPAGVYFGREQEAPCKRHQIKQQELMQRRLQNLQIAALQSIPAGKHHPSKLTPVSQIP